MEVITWLNSNSGAITAIATVVLVGITGFYAWVTKKMLEENRQMRLDAQTPEIAIYLRPEKTKIMSNSETTSMFLSETTSMFLYVENIRMAPAYDVEFTTDLTVDLPGALSLRDIGFLEFGVRYLPPRQKRKYFLGNRLYGGFDALMQKQLKIAVTYKGSVDEKYDKCFYLDFQEYRGE